MPAPGSSSQFFASPAVRPGVGQVILGAGEVPAVAGHEHLAEVYRLGDPALSELGLEALLDALLARAVEILDVDTAAILLHDDVAQELVARAAKGLEEEVERGVRIPIGGGFAGRIAAGRVPIFIADVDHAEVLNPILREKGVRSMLGVPLVAEGELLGVLHVGTLVPRTFTDGDAAVLQLVAARAAPAIERARIFERLEREHEAAVGLQRSLLPDRLPVIAGVPVAARYLPSRDEVGGDWYDVLPLARGAVGLVIGDVVGHGVRAAAVMAELRSALRAYAIEARSPGEVLERVNRMMHALREGAMATAAYAIFDPVTEDLHYAAAGHPPPLIVPRDGRARLLPLRPGPPLGSMPHVRFADHTAAVASGESVLLYTDGLVERRGEPLRDGFERLSAAATGVALPDELCRRVLRALVPPGGAPDDVALVALHNEPVPECLELELPARPETLAGVRRALGRWVMAAGATERDVATVNLAAGEACANAVEHAYGPSIATYLVTARMDDGVAEVVVRDRGSWRASRGRDRGRGLTIMRNAMDECVVRRHAGGTEVVLRRRLDSET